MVGDEIHGAAVPFTVSPQQVMASARDADPIRV